jgi:hypothetical protein
LDVDTDKLIEYVREHREIYDLSHLRDSDNHYKEDFFMCVCCVKKFNVICFSFDKAAVTATVFDVKHYMFPLL